MTGGGSAALPGVIGSTPGWLLAAIMAVALVAVTVMVLVRSAASRGDDATDFEAVFVDRDGVATPSTTSGSTSSAPSATVPPSPQPPPPPAGNDELGAPPPEPLSGAGRPVADTVEEHEHRVPTSDDLTPDDPTPDDAVDATDELLDEDEEVLHPDVAQPTEPGGLVWEGELAGGGNGATWAESETIGPTALAGLWMERSTDRGEDAPPSLSPSRDRPLGFVAVYDGTGGAGAGLAGLGDDGAVHTGAWLASRAVRAATEAWFADALTTTSTTEFTTALHEALDARLAVEMEQVAGSSRFAGTLRRDLPTTLAGGAYLLRPSGEVDVVTLWVGDSRVFLLTPASGLQQLTHDDSSAPDALRALIDDPPMNNIISASGNFTVNTTRQRVPGPVVVLAATDGCFGYVATPAHFELMVLRALASSADPGGWMGSLLESIQAITSDDASLAVASIGFESHREMRAAFSDRLERLEDEHWAPFEGIDHRDHAQLTEFRQRSWDSYRISYEALLEAGS